LIFSDFTPNFLKKMSDPLFLRADCSFAHFKKSGSLICSF